MLLSISSLLAFTCAGVALATPLNQLVPRSIPDVSLEARVDSCGSYSSKNGLNFTLYCEINNPFNDAFSPAVPNIANKEDCMELCSRYWGNGEGCFGMVFVAASNECWIRNSNTSTANFEAKEGHFSALLTSNDEMTGYATACPNTDLSVNTLSGIDGLEYTTHCGKVINQQDLCFSGYPCLDQPYYGFHHTETLEECLRVCVSSHPLCRAVSWNPGLQIGFANCWLKTGFPSDAIVDPRTNMGVLHSATITQIDPVDRNCPSSNTYAAAGNKNFDIHCGQLNQGSNITSVHTQNVTACMDACAASDQKCVGILFDSTLAGGFNNCYLQNTTSVISDQASATYAVLSNAALPSSSASPGSGSGSGSSSGGSSSSSSSSKAWIAGPVVGGLGGLAIIGAALFFWRRRKANRAVGGAHAPVEKHENGPGGYGPAPAYSPGVHHDGAGMGFGGAAATAPQQSYYDAPASEMDGRMTNELPASTKYAHNPKSQAVELA